MSPTLNCLGSTAKNLVENVIKIIIFIWFELLSPRRTLFVNMFQNIIDYLVIFAMKVLVVSHPCQHSIWVCGLIKWHLGTIGVIPSRCKVARGKLHCIEIVELAKGEGFHITLGHLACKYLMQASKCTDACLELVTVKTCQLYRLANEWLMSFIGSIKICQCLCQLISIYNNRHWLTSLAREVGLCWLWLLACSTQALRSGSLRKSEWWASSMWAFHSVQARVYQPVSCQYPPSFLLDLSLTFSKFVSWLVSWSWRSAINTRKVFSTVLFL